MSAFTGSNSLLLSDPSFIPIYERAKENYGSLKESEKHIADKLFQNYLASYHLMYMLNTDEVSERLDIDDLMSWLGELMSDHVVKPGFRSWWLENRFRYNTAGFNEKMDRVFQDYNDEDT